MKLLQQRKENSPVRLTALAKRVLITKAVARAHERLATRGSFGRAFIATGTWLPADHSCVAEVSLQGVEFEYPIVCSESAIQAHMSIVEAKKAKESERREALVRKIREENEKLSLIFQSSVERGQVI